jgi:hypothetical protein
MNDDIENELRRLLRPLEAPTGLAERVMRALPEQRAPAPVVALSVVQPASLASGWRRITVPATLAASLVVAVILGQHVARERVEDEQRAGLAASRELMQALRVTSQKLDAAYQAVQGSPPEANDEEENRS